MQWTGLVPRRGAREDISGLTVTVKNVCQRLFLFSNVHTVGFVRVTDCCKGSAFPSGCLFSDSKCIMGGGGGGGAGWEEVDVIRAS